MANGRRGSRGRGGKSVAQSGGKSTTFGGGKGGTKQTKASGGSAGQGVKAKGRLGSGTGYNVRGPGGDNTLTSRVGGQPSSLNILAFQDGNSGKTAFTHVQPTKRTGQARQRGGSTQ